MTTNVFRFAFPPTIDLAEPEATLQLAILAAEGLLGESAVRMSFTYFRDTPRRAILVDGGSEPGDAIVRVYTAFLNREFGAGGYSLRRLEAGVPAVGAPSRMGVAA